MLPIFLISNYVKREQLAKGKIKNTSLSGAEFLVTDVHTIYSFKSHLFFSYKECINATIMLSNLCHYSVLSSSLCFYYKYNLKGELRFEI